MSSDHNTHFNEYEFNKVLHFFVIYRVGSAELSVFETY